MPPWSAQEWCRANGAECLAVQPPGRAMRNKEEMVNSAAELAAQLLPIVASRLQQTPYIV
jgi:surfactin synthase thioesterase subunit